MKVTSRSVSTEARSPDLARAVLRKSREAQQTQEKFFSAEADNIVACARAMAEVFDRGGRLWVMGNGGSACDAQHMVVEFMHPIIDKRRPLPAASLAADSALTSAIGNDQDFARAFSRQLRPLGRADDIALGISTSGQSSNVNEGLTVAREIGMLTIGFSGRDGGRMAGLCDHCFVVPSFSIHRIQETHETLLHVLWDAIHVIGGAEDVL